MKKHHGSVKRSVVNYGYFKTSASIAGEMKSVFAIHTGVHIINREVKELTEGNVLSTTSVGVIYEVFGSNEKLVVRTLADIVKKVINAVMPVGSSVKPREVLRSAVYNPAFSHSYRRAKS